MFGKKRKRDPYSHTADKVVDGAVRITETVAVTSVAVGALGMLGSIFKK